MTERSFNLVEPLAHVATAMRTSETPGSTPARSRAVSHLSIRMGDVDSSISPAGLGIRTSTTATRTTTTRTTSSAPEPSADRHAATDFCFYDLVQAYFDCRRTKRNSASALAFEARLERNLRVAMQRIEHMPADDVFAAGNSYLGLIGQASHPHADRARLANALLARGHCVKSDLTKIYRNGRSTKQ